MPSITWRFSTPSCIAGMAISPRMASTESTMSISIHVNPRSIRESYGTGAPAGRPRGSTHVRLPVGRGDAPIHRQVHARHETRVVAREEGDHRRDVVGHGDAPERHALHELRDQLLAARHV